MATSDARTGRPPRTSVWLEERPAPRRRAAREKGEARPEGLDRQKIIATAVRLLDAEGLAKFSMRRLAADLGVTAMSVYWYVDSKDDLLELAMDAVEGELDLPDSTDGEGSHWREQLRQLAYEYRKLFNRHPWVSGMMGDYLNVGPRAMAFSVTAQRVMAHSGLPPQRISGALSALFQFVYGFATIEASWESRCRVAGLSSDAYFSTVWEKVSARPEYEEPLRLMDQRGGGTVEEMRERDFTVALDCIIAGIDAQRA
ncbi:TetR/AcrR family transcriptional regulator [Streptomyces sp. ODS28]|uniref:TetR/AcrR family transcriptional regulator n=1 Tax=Streptomyces sp. ODS28 TaxID=3136688 RepID=UPI0031F0A724